MNILRNVTEGIEPLPYQQALWDKLSQGGFKQGQMTLYGAVQHTGKSTFLKSAYYNNLCNEILLPMKPAPKYKFSRAKWYKADFYYTDYKNITDWCAQQFGPPPVNHDAWSRWWHNGQDRVFFRDAKDYEWFILRWS
jgi:hypothetical protein